MMLEWLMVSARTLELTQIRVRLGRNAPENGHTQFPGQDQACLPTAILLPRLVLWYNPPFPRHGLPRRNQRNSSL